MSHMTMRTRASVSLVAIAAAATLLVPGPASAQDVSARLDAMQKTLDQQRQTLDDQAATIARQQQEITDLRAMIGDTALAGYRAMGLQSGTPAPMPTPGTAVPAEEAQAQAIPSAPVGEAPKEQRDLKVEVAAVPQEQGVLTPAGHLTIDPIYDYTQAATDRLVFRGFELIPGIQVGLIEASKARTETLAPTMAFRYGVTNRLELEVRAPFFHRYDRIEVTQQRDQGIVRSIVLQENNIGDVELAARYQLNRATPDKPIYVASLRVKSDTGKGPFDIDYDQFGVATGLATGSGFWGVQPGFSFLLPSDPVVIFGGVNYLWHIGRDVDRTVGGAHVGKVNPGDAVTANLGFGFAVNPRFSFSLGYQHAYIFATHTQINDTIQKSAPLQVGALNFAMSYRLNRLVTANVAFAFGVTEDAPDLAVTIRFPFTL